MSVRVESEQEWCPERSVLSSIWCKTSGFIKSALRSGSWGNIGSPRVAKVVKKGEESGVQTTNCVFFRLTLDWRFSLLLFLEGLSHILTSKREVVVRFRFRCLVLNVGG